MTDHLRDSDETTFSGEIRVASRILDYLSSGLYPSPAACLKELINNSYDADAREVAVLVKPDADRIIIEDDGTGMSKFEFTTHFERITESHKRDRNDTTESGRPKIGKIGIGFIAANEICEQMEVFSTKSGSTELLHVVIDFEEMRKPPEERRRDGQDYIKADYVGEILEESDSSHYTQLFLNRVRGEAKEILAGASPQSAGKAARSLYGMSPASVAQTLKDPTLKTWKEFDAYSETLLHVALNVPVPYHDEWIPDGLKEPVKVFEDEARDLELAVKYDGTQLRKPIVFSPNDGDALVSPFSFEGESVSAKGYFYAQHGNIRPLDLHGLLVRIRHAAVGEYDSSFWGFSPNEASLIQRWVSAEIWADDRLEEAMNIDRRTLRVAHPAYVELRNAIHRHLRHVLKLARTEIYEAGNKERKAERTRSATVAVADVAAIVAPVAPLAAERLHRTAIAAASDPAVGRAIQKKYTAAQFYEILVHAADGLFSSEQIDELLRRISERIER